MNYETGDVTSIRHGFILQQVNCQGVMGSGVAKAIKSKWPIVEVEYLKLFQNRPMSHRRQLLGHTQIVEVVPDNLYIVNLFGQEFYGRDGKRYTSYDALDTALSTLKKCLKDDSSFETLSIHHPLIGCGLGGGSWPVVEALIETHLGNATTCWMPPLESM